MTASDAGFDWGPYLIQIIPLAVMLYWQRGINKLDKEKQEWKDSMEARMSAVEAKGHTHDLMIQEKVTRADLDRTTKDVFDEIKDLRVSVESKFDALQRLVLEAIQRKP